MNLFSYFVHLLELGIPHSHQSDIQSEKEILAKTTVSLHQTCFTIANFY